MAASRRGGAILFLFSLSLAAILPAGAVTPARLPADQMAAAARTDALTIPTPGELFAALAKTGKQNWPAQYRAPLPTTYRSRAKIALNLGGLIADGFIAVEAQDSQQVKNIGGDVIKLARSLGVSENLLARGNSIGEFAENNDWNALKEELEATQNEVKASMDAHHDRDLVILVSLGGWIRATQVVSNVVLQNYDPRAAKVLRQPALVAFLHAKMNEMSPELTKDPLVQEIDGALTNLQKMVTFPLGKTPGVDEVRQVNEAVMNLMAKIQVKSDAK